MKKIILCVLIGTLFLNLDVYAARASLFEARDKIFKLANEMKPMMGDKKDAVLISSMRDTCLMATTQVDAYFSMLGVFNEIREEDLSKEAVDYLTRWLDMIIKTNKLNIDSMASIPSREIGDKITKDYMKTLGKLLKELNEAVEVELNKLSFIERAVRK